MRFGAMRFDAVRFDAMRLGAMRLGAMQLGATRWIPLLVLALVTGCVSAPPFEYVGPAGSVRALTLERAQEMSALHDLYSQRIRERLPATHDGEVTVWVQERPQVVWFFRPGEEVPAFRAALWNRVHLTDASESLQIEFAHELVHALVDGSWDDFPPILMEGVCDQMSGVVSGRENEVMAERLLLATEGLADRSILLRIHHDEGIGEAPILSGLEVTPVEDPLEVFDRSSFDIDPFFGSDRKGGLYGLGYFVCGRLFERHGIDGTYRLVREAREERQSIARRRIANAAGLDTSLEGWRSALRAELERNLPRIADGLLEGVVESLIGWAWTTGRDVETAIRDARPEIRVSGRETSVALTSLPRFDAVLAKAIPGAGPPETPQP